jgi:hypothetical protein
MWVRNAVLGITTLLSAGYAAADVVSLSATVNGAPNPSQIVVIHFTGTIGTQSYTNFSGAGYAGLINWNNATGTDTTGTLLSEMPTSFAGSGTFSTFCIDITQDIGVGGTYPFTGLTTTLSNTPVVLATENYTGMGATDAQEIENLYFNEFNSVISANSNDQAAAFQIAIWDIIYGINATPASVDVTNSSNGFWVDNTYNNFSTFGNVTSLADGYVEAALTGPTRNFGAPILALTTPVYQDQLVVGVPGTSKSPPLVPTPAEVTGGMALLGGLAAAKRMRRAR